MYKIKALGQELCQALSRSGILRPVKFPVPAEPLHTDNMCPALSAMLSFSGECFLELLW